MQTAEHLHSIVRTYACCLLTLAVGYAETSAKELDIWPSYGTMHVH